MMKQQQTNVTLTTNLTNATNKLASPLGPLALRLKVAPGTGIEVHDS